MLIEISEKEKTALSLLLGLRQKFALAKREKESYSAVELHKLFSEAINKINKEEIRFIDTLILAHKPKHENPVWDQINKQIDRSTIKRYNWNEVFGRSLTQEILNLKKIGLSVDETYKSIKEDKRVKTFINLNKGEKRKILENLKTSVHARFGENNTANKVWSEE